MIEEQRMDAYYYGFEPTGVVEIDRILSAVACAGKAYHHTEEWNSEIIYGTSSGAPDPFLRGKNPVEWIQNAAYDAAAVWKGAAKVERAMFRLSELTPLEIKAIDAKIKHQPAGPSLQLWEDLVDVGGMPPLRPEHFRAIGWAIYKAREEAVIHEGYP